MDMKSTEEKAKKTAKTIGEQVSKVDPKYIVGGGLALFAMFVAPVITLTAAAVVTGAYLYDKHSGK